MASAKRLLTTWITFICCLMTTGLQSFEISRTAHSARETRWHQSCVHYSIHQDAVPGIPFSELQRVVRQAFDAWELVDGSYLYFNETTPADYDQIGFNADRGNMNLLIWRRTGWPYAPFMVAYTTVSADEQTGEILDVDIEFNAEHFTFSLVPTADTIDLENTLVHEIGHMLGLGHSSDVNATMYETAAYEETVKRSLSGDDIAAMTYLYPAVNDPAVCGELHCGLATNEKTLNEGCTKSESTDTVTADDNCSFAPAIPARAFLLALLLP